ncbi:hypothetical protein EniLVp02_0192 [Vibrio phage EniLVp02]
MMISDIDIMPRFDDKLPLTKPDIMPEEINRSFAERPDDNTPTAQVRARKSWVFATTQSEMDELRNEITNTREDRFEAYRELDELTLQIYVDTLRDLNQKNAKDIDVDSVMMSAGQAAVTQFFSPQPTE